MAFRPLKRVLGETSLEKKCRWMFGLSLGLLMTASFLLYSKKTDIVVAERNEALGKALVDSVLVNKHVAWFSKTMAQRLPQNQQTQQEVDEIQATYDDILRDTRTLEYGYGFILPTDDQQGSNLYPPTDEEEWDLHNKWLAVGEALRDRIRSGGETFEEAIESLGGEAVKPYGRPQKIGGDRMHWHYQPVFAEEGCLVCHETRRAVELGELLAIVRVNFDDKETVAAQNRNRAIMIASAFVTAFLSMIALYIIVRFVIVKPLKHLRDVSNAVRQGDVDQRAHIRTGDEFEELGTAFNRMVRQLLSQQDELRNVNAALDKKLDELAEANLRLFEMNRLKSDFLSTVSHELRTPLNSILGFSEVLTTQQELTEKQRRFAGNIQRSGRMLLDMINDILDLAKIESGKMAVNAAEFRIDAVVVELCDMVRPLAEKKKIDLGYEIQPNMPPLVQDQAKVQQILNNLLSNAIKFTPEGGRITVAARRDDEGDLRLIVEDTGVGISKKEQQVVFEKFRQGQTVLPSGDTMTREYSGTGLGLSIVKELCRLLGGEVTLESELGRGSIFRVRLPWVRTQPLELDSELVSQLDDLTKPALRSGRRATSTGGEQGGDTAPVDDADTAREPLSSPASPQPAPHP